MSQGVKRRVECSNKIRILAKSESSAKISCDGPSHIASFTERFTSSLGDIGMSTDGRPPVLELLPNQAWDLLTDDQNTVLVDVRSKPEWGFVGTPDLSSLGRSAVFVEWASFPGMSANAGFADEVLQALDGATPSAMLFLCRSGVRSLGAAGAMTEAFERSGKTVSCINVSEGFEGDLDPQHHRGGLNGWKARGLPWRQS